MTDMLYAAAQALDPLGDAEAQRGITKNFAKVGSSRPSSLLYTYGPGSIMDLPAFTIMPAGLDDWDKIWTRRNGHPTVHAPRLLEVVRDVLGDQVAELRPFPSQPARAFSREGDDLGVPARVFPQWLRCTGCGLLAPLTHFDYRNTHPYRPDRARFDHENCRGRSGRGRAGGTKAARRQAVAARYLLVCPAGHADEFPYQLWVHRGKPCEKAEFPALRMEESSAGRGASGTVVCLSCDLRRSMSEAQGEAGRAKLPRCRGRHPHLGAFEPDGCGNETRLMLIGASNLWFPATQAIIVMPQSRAETTLDLADQVRREIGDDLPEIHSQLGLVRMVLRRTPLAEVADLADDRLAEVVARAQQPPRTDDQRQEKLRAWDPVDLLVPEWQYLQRDPLGQKHDDPSGLVLSARARGAALPASVSRVLAVDKLRRVNALVGFTRVDELDRVSDDDRRLRLVPLTRDRRPTWTVATEDRGEGIFLQLDEVAVAAWEARIEAGPLWAAHRQVCSSQYRGGRKLVDDARESVTCATFNFQTTSGMWDALARAAGRDEVAVTVYLDTLASQPAGGWVPPSAEAVAAHLKPARVFRTTSYEGRLVRTHAKFLAIDHRILVVTSANFSWSAENGNVEFGVRIDDVGLTEAVEKQLWDAEPVVYERVRGGPPFELGEQR